MKRLAAVLACLAAAGCAAQQSPSERISLTLVLKSRTPDLAAIERSRHFIDPRTFGARFGITLGDERALRRQLVRDGLTITATFPQRTELIASAPRATVERLLHTRIANHAPISAPTIPSQWRSTVEAVTGLDTRRRWHAEDVPAGGLSPATAATAYDVSPLRGRGFTGRRQTIAVISYAAFDPNDPAVYQSHYAVNGPSPQVVSVDGGTRDTSGAAEANLDLEVIRAIAPQARILVYEVPQSSSSYADAISRIVADRKAEIISTSWGQCELGLSGAERSAESRALAAAVATGVTMFAASGDSGAYDCQRDNPAFHRLSVDWPASSANAVAVGGTRLYLGPTGSYQDETAWEGQLSAAGGGGGLTIGDARPSWQAGPGVISALSNGHRQLPDVAANADPGTGWSIYSGGQPGMAGGTSAAAPFWAASMLLIREYAGRRLGYINPILYALAARRQPFAPFHDIVRGANRHYEAGPGWDAATGLGSPDVYNLARDIVAYLKAHGR